jgi:cytochrome P450
MSTVAVFDAVLGNFRSVGADGFEFDGVKVPAGTTVFYNTVATNYDPNIFPHPHVFDIGRWLEDPKGRARPFSVLTFGAGPRNCAGQLFARTNLKTFISVLLREYEWDIDEKAQDMSVQFSPNLTFRDGGRATVRRRTA